MCFEKFDFKISKEATFLKLPLSWNLMQTGLVKILNLIKLIEQLFLRLFGISTWTTTVPYCTILRSSFKLIFYFPGRLTPPRIHPQWSPIWWICWACPSPAILGATNSSLTPVSTSLFILLAFFVLICLFENLVSYHLPTTLWIKREYDEKIRVRLNLKRCTLH